MIGVDTNVVIRHVTQDDPAQSEVASALFESFTEAEPGYLSLVTIVETYWVLTSVYRLRPLECLELIGRLLDAREIVIGHDDVVRAACAEAKNGIGFADAVIAELGRSAGCGHTETFDRDATRHSAMRLLET